MQVTINSVFWRLNIDHAERLNEVALLYIIQSKGDVEDATFAKIFCITNHNSSITYP